MKKSFSDYAESSASKNGKGGDGRSDARFGAGGNAKMNGAAFDMLKAMADKYEGASEKDLISAILAEAVKARAAGTLSDEEIDSFAAQISPMLTQAQRSRLNAVIAKIKNTGRN